MEYQERPKNYLVESILVTIFCCQIFGIVGIVYASQVNSKYDSGDYLAAQRASKSAKTWVTVGLVVGIVVALIFIALYGTIIGAAISSGEFNDF